MFSMSILSERGWTGIVDIKPNLSSEKPRDVVRSLTLLESGLVTKRDIAAQSATAAWGQERPSRPLSQRLSPTAAVAPVYSRCLIR